MTPAETFRACAAMLLALDPQDAFKIALSLLGVTTVDHDLGVSVDDGWWLETALWDYAQNTGRPLDTTHMIAMCATCARRYYTAARDAALHQR